MIVPSSSSGQNPPNPLSQGGMERTTINILLSVVDNLGDIGFACELVRGFHEEFRGRYEFVIWTDDVGKTEVFFEKNRDDIASYQVRKIEDIEKMDGNILFLLFHHPLPSHLPERDLLILRVDYLSFDSEWVSHHGQEHIESRALRQIIEIIPSPLRWSGGLIAPTERFLDRDTLAQKYGLNPGKKWISIFAYRETLEKNLMLDKLENTEIIIMGSGILSEENPLYALWTLHSLPFLSLREFSSIVRESKWAIVRGEVSFISTLQVGTPLMWDMYKGIGGWHGEQAEDFLEWSQADGVYRDLFMRINGRCGEKTKLSELEAYFSGSSHTYRIESENLVEEMQKYIDKHAISL